MSDRGLSARIVTTVATHRQLVTSQKQLYEVKQTLQKPSVMPLVGRDRAEALVYWIEDTATISNDPRRSGEILTRDPDDEFLVALARYAGAELVTHDVGILEVHPPSVRVAHPENFAVDIGVLTPAKTL